jgi:integrase
VADFDLITGHEDPLLIDPTRGLRLPASTGRRERIATPDEARRLIEALQPPDRALWATAMYAGLRHGELRALQARDVDLKRRRIDVKRGWDQYEGEIDPKSEKAPAQPLSPAPYGASSPNACEKPVAKAPTSSSAALPASRSIAAP